MFPFDFTTKPLNPPIYTIPSSEKDIFSSQDLSFMMYRYAGVVEKDEPFSGHYSFSCEKEVINKFYSNKEVTKCMDTYVKNFNESKTFGQMYNSKYTFLDCLKTKDENVYKPMMSNFQGVDMVFFDIFNYNHFCDENLYIVKHDILFSSGIFIVFISFMLALLLFDSAFFLIFSSIFLVIYYLSYLIFI